MATAGTPERARAVRIAALYLLVLAAFVLGWMEREPYDDSYFFKRFALNFLDHGVLAWNVREGPVYGSTSQLFQAVELALTALTRSYTLFATRIFLVLCLALAYAGAFALTVRRDGGLAATLAFGSPVALYAVTSGMETALVFALLVAVLLLLYSEAGRRLHWALAPLGVVAVWLARPDAVVLALPPLLAERWAGSRRLPVREVALMGGLALGFLGLFAWYYGTAFPLPFYAKQVLFSPYDEHFLSASTRVRVPRLGLFLFTAAPLVAAALLRRDRVNGVLLASVASFELYHVTMTIEVMGMQGRFYAPALPLLVLAAARGVETAPASERGVERLFLGCGAALVLLAIAGFLPKPDVGRGEGVPLAFYLFGLLAAALVFVVPRSRAVRRHGAEVALGALLLAVIQAWTPRLRAPPSDEEYLDLHARNVTVFRGMDVLRACFGDAIHVYHSEVGVPGLRFARGTVSDFAGLMSPDWLFGRRSFDASCLAERPEAIFLPHRNYVTLNRIVQESRCLDGYERVVRDSSSPLYVRRDLRERYAVCRAVPKDR